MTDLFTDLANLLDPPPAEGALTWYCDRPGCDGKPHDDLPYRHARAAQHPPRHILQWFLWLILAGRGFGKTRTGAEWLVDRMKGLPGTYWALVAPTFDDGRDTMVEGESGLEFVLDQHKVQYTWNRSLGQLVLRNDARLDLFSSQKPESLRGPNLSGAWGDEPATWTYPDDTWTNLLLMCRKGHPQIVITGTPKPSMFIKTLKKEADYVTTGSSYDNRDNLADVWYDKVIKPLEGTRMGRQEIYGEIMEEIEGALWSSGQLDATRLVLPRRLDRLIIAVDPSVSAKKRDECGIMVGGRNRNHAWAMDDLSLQAAPEAWAQRVCDVYRDIRADCVVAEVNNGGDLVTTVMKQIDPTIKVKTVHASRGKIPRAEPVAALYGDPSNPETWARATCHHQEGVAFNELEDEMTTYLQGDKNSPNRMDALVWLFSDLLNIKVGQRGRGGLRHR